MEVPLQISHRLNWKHNIKIDKEVPRKGIGIVVINNNLEEKRGKLSFIALHSTRQRAYIHGSLQHPQPRSENHPLVPIRRPCRCIMPSVRRQRRDVVDMYLVTCRSLEQAALDRT